MAKHPDDDNFAHSTMSFGDHLEELRGALFRAVIGLMIGFGLGLIVANYVVEWIKEPLVASLEKFYLDKTIDQLNKENPDAISAEMEDFIREKRLIFEKQFIEVSELNRLNDLRLEYVKEHPEASEGSKVDAKPPAEENKAINPVSTAATDTKKKVEKPVILGEEKLPPPGNVMVVTRAWRPIQTVVKALNAQEVFMIWMKAGLVMGAVIASPYIFLQVWNFVAAGLYPHEKRYVHMYVPVSLGLFLAGAALCFYFVIPQVLDWLFSFNRTLNIDPDPRINEWLGFALFLPLGFGISFQLPLVMLLLNRIGIFSVEIYLSHWRISVLVIFVISMILTPADPVSMLFMAIPLTFLYFGGIAMCQWMPRGRNPFDEAYEP